MARRIKKLSVLTPKRTKISNYNRKNPACCVTVTFYFYTTKIYEGGYRKDEHTGTCRENCIEVQAAGLYSFNGKEKLRFWRDTSLVKILSQEQEVRIGPQRPGPPKKVLIGPQ